MCSDISFHRVTAFSSKSLSLRLFLWNLLSDIWKPIEVYGEKGISSVKKWKEAF
ncbi:nef attachable domain protein, partial [Chlamydia psittaci 02DC21]